MTDTAWDRLLDLIDHVTADPESPTGKDLERTLVVLCEEAIEEGSIDRELHVPDTARWLTALIAAHRIVRQMHRDIPADNDLATLRVIVTRWLYPARPR